MHVRAYVVRTYVVHVYVYVDVVHVYPGLPTWYRGTTTCTVHHFAAVLHLLLTHIYGIPPSYGIAGGPSSCDTLLVWHIQYGIPMAE